MRCTSIWGHRFVARYSIEQRPITAEMMQIAAYSLMDLKMPPHKRYEGDICVRCGALAQKVSGRES